MTSISIQAACALSREKFAVLRMEDEAWKDEADHEVLLINKGASPIILKRTIHNVKISRSSSTRDEIVILSRTGHVEFIDFNGKTIGSEEITGARIKSRLPPEHGFLTSITLIDERLFACGMGGQVYTRTCKNKWDLISQQLLAEPNERWLTNIQGRNQNSLLVDGLNGGLYFYNGNIWSEVKTGTTSAIGELIFLENDTVYICGVRSMILHGNERQGFAPISLSTGNTLFYTICRFQERIFIGSDRGLYEFDRSTKTIKLNNDIYQGDIFSLQAVDEVMWCFSTKNVFRFDGNRWEQMDHMLP